MRNEIPETIPVTPSSTFPSRNLHFMELAHFFRGTEHGGILASQTRFDRYQFIPGPLFIADAADKRLSREEIEAAGLEEEAAQLRGRKKLVFSNEEWERLLGADVNNFRHNTRTYELTRWFIGNLSEQLSEEDSQILLFSATVHDWAEAVVGDINFDFETKEIKDKETKELRDILLDYFGDNGVVPEENIAMIDTALEIINKGDSYLAELFNTVERVGYLLTGLRAARLSRSDLGSCKKDELCKQERLNYLAGGVIGNQLTELLRRKEKFNPVSIILGTRSDDIDFALEVVSVSYFDREEDPNPEKTKEKFRNTKLAWEEYREGVGS